MPEFFVRLWHLKTDKINFLDDRVTFLSLNKLNKKRSNWTVLALAVCFSLVALFGSPLHDHDLDPTQFDPTCAPCHLIHSSIGLETDTPDFFVPTKVTQWVPATATVSFISTPLTASSRAPPTFC